MSKSFFEYLGIADLERVHSQFLAWMLSDDCNGIDPDEKNKLFKGIFKIDGVVKEVYTERKGIDILIKTSSDIVVIENKIKTSQHSNQLDAYKEICDKDFPDLIKHFYYLTLIGENSNNKYWKRISYKIIYESITALNVNQNIPHGFIIKEYILFLERLINVLEDFNAHVVKYDFVFNDGNKKKYDKKINDYKSDNADNEWFIASNQLETILQKSFLNSIVDKLNPFIGSVDETRGTALVNFIIRDKIKFRDRDFLTGIQIQGNSIKFFFSVIENYNYSNKEWVKDIVSFFSDISKQKDKNLGYIQLNKPTSRAYISVSKKLYKNYWQMENIENYIKNEIKNGEILTDLLMEYINTYNLMNL
jgi:PD-(D/E)XK nuclease superfamily